MLHMLKRLRSVWDVGMHWDKSSFGFCVSILGMVAVCQRSKCLILQWLQEKCFTVNLNVTLTLTRNRKPLQRHSILLICSVVNLRLIQYSLHFNLSPSRGDQFKLIWVHSYVRNTGFSQPCFHWAGHELIMRISSDVAAPASSHSPTDSSWCFSSNHSLWPGALTGKPRGTRSSAHPPECGRSSEERRDLTLPFIHCPLAELSHWSFSPIGWVRVGWQYYEKYNEYEKLEYKQLKLDLCK